MTEHERWQLPGDAADVYERCFVPAISGPWAPIVTEAATIGAADRVLDVGCGTGVLARAVADRVAADGQVTGLDRDAGMLAVARRLRPTIDWRQGEATSLPFADGSYDVVVSQFALMWFPDRVAALKEMVRVVRPGGRLAIAVWGPFARATGHVILTAIARRWCGPVAADVLMAPFALGDEDQIRDLVTAAGIGEAVVALRAGTMTFPTIETFVDAEIKGSPLEARLDEASYQGLIREAHDELRRFRDAGGDVTMPMDAFIITAGNA